MLEETTKRFITNSYCAKATIVTLKSCIVTAVIYKNSSLKFLILAVVAPV